MTEPTGADAGAVCVLGSFMMDLAARAPRRPAAGETVVGTDFAMHLGGKGFNQAVAAARAGARTTMIGRRGDDDFGARFAEALAAEHIDSAHVAIDPDEGTGIGLPLVDGAGENSIVVVPRANRRITEDDVLAAAPAIEAASILLVQLELPVHVVTAAIAVARAGGVPVILNPAPALPDTGEVARLADVVVPNVPEAIQLCRGDRGRPAGDTGPVDLADLAAAVRERTGASVVLTAGPDGAWVADGAVHHLPPHAVEVVDTVGAGDAFCGNLAAALARGESLLDAAVVANAAGALAVTRRGAEPSMPERAATMALHLGRARHPLVS